VSITHADLVARAKRWLLNTRGCGVVVTEWHSGTSETPDAIGWGSGGRRSILVECKVSVPDFVADRRKHFRRAGTSAGRERFYMTPPGLIRPDKLQDGWGLLEVAERHGRVKVVAPAEEFDTCPLSEVSMLYSALLRGGRAVGLQLEAANFEPEAAS
jgi:hypothetical protein